MHYHYLDQQRVRRQLRCMGAAEDPLAVARAGAKQVYDALVSVGVRDPTASFADYQAYHETNAFSDPKFKALNNASGIKYAKQKGAKRGKNGYADFTTLKDWANAMKHEMTKGSNPAGAKTIEDYVNRLKQNKYFEDSVDNYLHGLTRARLVLRTMPAADTADNTTDYNTDTGVSTPKKKKKDWLPLLEGVALTVGGILIIKLFDNLVE